MAEHSTSVNSSDPAGTRALIGQPLECVVVTPETTALEQTADFVALPLYDGEIGIASGHSPLIGRLGFGEMRIKSGGQTQRFYVDGGFVQVVGNVVSVLTNRAIPAEQIDRQAAQEQLSAARAQHPSSDEEFAQRDTLEAQARALLQVAAHVSGRDTIRH